MGSSQSTDNGSATESKNLYQRYQDKKRGEPISDEDLKKYTGKTRDEINEWAESRPGVGKNQLAGGVAIGPASGLGGVATADGFGGWGPGSGHKPDRGMKFPPPQGKTVE